MSVVLSSELVIGNLLIEAVRENREMVRFSEIMKFEDRLNKKLREENRNCYSDVLVGDIAETVGLFNKYFHEQNGTIRIIKIEESEKNSRVEHLVTFFREGLSRWLTELMSTEWNALFEQA